MPTDKTPFLRLAVVGHTNTGKTSLLRTLTRDPRFGEVRDSPGTTRQVEGARLLVGGEAVVELFDTPGMEDSIALADYFGRLAPGAERIDGPDLVDRFLRSPESSRRFEQEARVLRQLRECDAGLYVVDVRDPVLGKHKDELAILARCGRPLLPVLNFIHSPGQKVQRWREALARLGLHAIVEFDTIAPALDGEAQLYDKLALLLDSRTALLSALKDDVARQRAIRLADACRLIAEMLVDVAALRLSTPTDEASMRRSTEALRAQVRNRENDCVRALLKRYNFNLDDFSSHGLPLEGERWGMDLFHPHALKDMGARITKGMAAGAMAGATVDIFLAGLSLGSAALIGAATGGLWQGADRIGKRIVGRIRGYQELSVTDDVLRLLALREMTLAEALEHRGHAAQSPIVLPLSDGGRAAAADGGLPAPPGGDAAWDARLDALRTGKLPEELMQARGQPQWSGLSDHPEPGPRREQAVRALAARLMNPAPRSPQ